MGRQLSAVGCAILIWTFSWAAAWLVWFVIAFGASDAGKGNPTLVELAPAIALAVLGPIVAILIGRRLWRA